MWLFSFQQFWTIYQCVWTRFNIIPQLCIFTSQYSDRFKVTLEIQSYSYYMRFLLKFLKKKNQTIFILLHVHVCKGLMEIVRTARTVLTLTGLSRSGLMFHCLHPFVRSNFYVFLSLMARSRRVSPFQIDGTLTLRDRRKSCHIDC